MPPKASNEVSVSIPSLRLQPPRSAAHSRPHPSLLTLALSLLARLPILNSDLVRLRLTSTKFQEHEPGPPRERTRVVDGIVEEIPLAEGEEVLPGWLLEGTIAEQGLGCVDWWPVPEEEEPEAEGEGEMIVD